MFKKIIAVYIITIVSLFTNGCKYPVKASALQEPAAIPEDKPVARDFSINKSNSYNDIFLDSADIEKFIVEEKLTDTMSVAIRSFYNARNYEYAWFAGTGLIEQSFSFRSLYSSEDDTDNFNKSLENRLDRLRTDKNTNVAANDPATIQTELQITQRFIQYALKNYADMGISPDALGIYIPAEKRTITGFADFVLANNSINSHYAALNESYRLLKVPLQQYNTFARNGGWPTIEATSWIRGLRHHHSKAGKRPEYFCTGKGATVAHQYAKNVVDAYR